MDQATLSDILCASGSIPLTNPGQHSPLGMRQNRVIAEVVGPDGEVKQRVDHTGNIMLTYGLNRAVEMLASDAGGASGWVSAMAIGTDTTAANSTNNALGNSTQIIHLSQASMVASDGGNLTLQYNGTFASDGNAAAINEVGLFATNAATAAGVARSVLGTDSINRGSADEIRISYQVVFGTV
jgi:hypothetical protein